MTALDRSVASLETLVAEEESAEYGFMWQCSSCRFPEPLKGARYNPETNMLDIRGVKELYVVLWTISRQDQEPLRIPVMYHVSWHSPRWNNVALSSRQQSRMSVKDWLGCGGVVEIFSLASLKPTIFYVPNIRKPYPHEKLKGGK